MSYQHNLLDSQWMKTTSPEGSYYSKRLGNSGINGCSVTEISTQEIKGITKWLKKHNIERKLKREDTIDTNMWWFMERFSENNLIGEGPNRMFSSGYYFRMSVDAYNALFG